MTGYALVAFAATLWGSWVLFLRPSSLPGPTTAFIVLLMIALPAPFAVRRSAFRDRTATLALLALGVADALNTYLVFSAIQRGPIAVAILTHYLAPLWVALAAPLLLGERRSLRALIVGPVVLLGLGLVIGGGQGAFSWRTALEGSASSIFFAGMMLATKRAGRAFSPLAVTSLHSFISVATLLVLFGQAVVPTSLSSGVLWVAAGGLVCGLFGNVLFATGMRRISAQAASVLTYLEPLTAATIGYFAFAEPIGPWGVLGAAAVLGSGIWVATERRAEQSTAASAKPIG